MQIGIEDDDGFERKNFMHQFGELRARLDVQIHLQGAARELVEVVHLAAPGVRLPGVLRDARGKPADHQCRENEGQERDGVCGFAAGLIRTWRAVR